MSTTISQIKFRKIRNIGNDQGANSETFEAEDMQMDARLFIKRIEKEALKKQGLDMEDYFLEARLLYEGKHPNIAEIHYASEDDKNIYLSMPLYKNGSLSKRMNDSPLTVREIIKYSLDILSGLSYIHSKKMVHLDLKPTNILIDDTGRARITDFGLSRLLNEDGFTIQPISYSFHREPEAISNRTRDIYSDIYQFGLLLYRMCYGDEILQQQAIYLTTTKQKRIQELILNGDFPIRSYYIPHIPESLRKIINKCINVNIKERYRNTIEIMNDISDVKDFLDWKYNGSYVLENQDENKKIEININKEEQVKRNKKINVQYYV